MKISEKLKENKMFFIIFGLMTLTSIIHLSERNIDTLVDPLYTPLYVVNYDCGYSSRLFIGALFSLFWDGKLDVFLLSEILLCIYFVLCFCISLFINHYLKNTPHNNTIGIYIFLTVISPLFLSLLKFLGTTDIFWIFLVLASLFSVDKKYLRWLIPVFCFIALAIHEVFAVTYLPIIAIAVFYRYVKKPNASNLIFICACALTVGAASVYFVLIGDNTMKMTSDEMVQFAAERLKLHGIELPDFYLRSIFYWDVPDVEAYHGLGGFLKYNFEKFIISSDNSIRQTVFYIILNAFMSVPFFALIITALKKEENKGKKFIFICSLLIAIPTVLLLLTSTDTERYSLHYVFDIIFLSLFFAKERDESFSEALDKFTAYIKSNKTVTAILALMGTALIFNG